ARGLSLALTRLRAPDPGRRIGSIFFNPGGPGGSGGGFLPAVGSELYSAEVRGPFGLGRVDPRGVAPPRPPTPPRPPRPRSRSRSPAPRSGSGSGPPAPTHGPAPSAAGRSWTTCPPPTWPATWTCCAGRSATAR